MIYHMQHMALHASLAVTAISTSALMTSCLSEKNFDLTFFGDTTFEASISSQVGGVACILAVLFRFSWTRFTVLITRKITHRIAEFSIVTVVISLATFGES